MRRILLCSLLFAAPAWAEPDDGTRQLLQAIQREPTNAQAYVALAQRYEELERIPEAIRAFEKAVELEPKNEGHYLRLADLSQYQMEKPGAAEAVLRQCLVQVPHAFDARMQLADLLMERERWDASKPLYEEAKRIKPAATGAWAGLVAIATLQGQSGQWESLFQGWQAAVGSDLAGSLFFSAAEKVPDSRDPVKEKLLLQAISLSPQEQAPYTSLVVVYNNLHKDNEVRNLYQEMMTRFPQDPFAFAQMGMLSMENARFAEAEQAFIQLVAKAPDDPFSYLSLTEALVKQGKKADARRWLEQGLEKIPADPILQDALKGL